MPLQNIERIRDKFSSFGNTSKKEDIDKEFNQIYDNINLLIDTVNKYENAELSFIANKDRAGEYLYINDEGHLTTKAAYIDDFEDFVATARDIEDKSITARHINNGAINSEHLANEVVTNMPIGALQVTSEHIADKSIFERHIGEDITSEKIANGAIGQNNLQEGIILPTHISDNGFPLRCLPDFGIAHYVMYNGNEDKAIPIQYFYLERPEEYSLIIENKSSITISADNNEITLETINNVFNPNVLSFVRIKKDNEIGEETEETHLSTEGTDSYSAFKLPPKLIQVTHPENNKYTYYYSHGAYYVLPCNSDKFYPVNNDKNFEFQLRIKKFSELNNNENSLQPTSCVGFAKVYLSRNINTVEL